MDPNIVILNIGGVTAIVIVTIYATSLSCGEKSIFRGSGSPISMAQMLLSSLHATGQILFGISAIMLLALLILNDTISSDAGLPIFSAIVAYLLGKTYKDISFLSKKKKNN